jgi:cell wall assembly regulator SMI1
MKKVKIEQPEKKLTSSEINDFEFKFNVVIPLNLKKLYLKYNGGLLSDEDEFSYDFASIKYGDFKLEGLIEDLQITEKTIPNNYLPFLISGVGNIITISLDENNQGKIYLFRYDDLEPILMKNSLEEFLGVRSIDEL